MNEYLLSKCDSLIFLFFLFLKGNFIIGFIRGTLGYGATGIDLSGRLFKLIHITIGFLVNLKEVNIAEPIEQLQFSN